MQGKTQATSPAHVSDPAALDSEDQGRNLNLTQTNSKFEWISVRPELQLAPRTKPHSLILHAMQPKNRSVVCSHIFNLCALYQIFSTGLYTYCALVFQFVSHG